jgi:hypothetical protein
VPALPLLQYPAKFALKAAVAAHIVKANAASGGYLHGFPLQEVVWEQMPPSNAASREREVERLLVVRKKSGGDYLSPGLTNPEGEEHVTRLQVIEEGARYTSLKGWGEILSSQQLCIPIVHFVCDGRVL